MCRFEKKREKVKKVVTKKNPNCVSVVLGKNETVMRRLQDACAAREQLRGMPVTVNGKVSLLSKIVSE